MCAQVHSDGGFSMLSVWVPACLLILANLKHKQNQNTEKRRFSGGRARHKTAGRRHNGRNLKIIFVLRCGRSPILLL